MKHCINFSILAMMVSAMVSCRPDGPETNNTAKVQAVVDSVRKDLSDSLGIAYPSLSLLIQTPHEKLFASSVAASVQPVTPGTYFRFASNTKNFTAASILNMYEDGWLDFKQKITDTIPNSKITYVPNTPEWNIPYKNEITIEQLLQHAAGIFDVDNDPVPGYGGLSYTESVQNADPMHQFSTDEMVNVLTQKNLFYFAPGKGHHYSNTGFSILAKIIARVYTFRSGTEKTYADYLKDYITGDKAPVPLKTMHFPILASDVALPQPRVTGAVLSTTGTVTYDSFNMSAQVGEGNGYGTLNDMNTYIRTMMKGQNVLNPATVTLMQKNLSPGDTSYALGCTFTRNLGYGHNGARIGYLSLMAYDPQYDISVVAMVNLWDLRNGISSFIKCLYSLQNAAYAARKALGYPGKP